MTYTHAIAAGILQGLTEFLPVSSSGHLRLLHHFGFGTPVPLLFDVILHAGTFFATILYFRKILAIIGKGCAGELRAGNMSGANIRSVIRILLCVIPAGLTGIFFKTQIETFFSGPEIVCIMLLVTAVFLSIPFILKKKTAAACLRDSRSWRTRSVPGLAAAGIAQAVAIIPGISRSGSTISTALFMGFPPASAGEFSFLISLPAIAGAVFLELFELSASGWILDDGMYYGHLILGFCISLAVGYAAITILMRTVRSGKLWYFAPYCAAAGIAGLVFINL